MLREFMSQNNNKKPQTHNKTASKGDKGGAAS